MSDLTLEEFDVELPVVPDEFVRAGKIAVELSKELGELSAKGKLKASGPQTRVQFVEGNTAYGKLDSYVLFRPAGSTKSGADVLGYSQVYRKRGLVPYDTVAVTIGFQTWYYKHKPLYAAVKKCMKPGHQANWELEKPARHDKQKKSSKFDLDISFSNDLEENFENIYAFLERLGSQVEMAYRVMDKDDFRKMKKERMR